MPRVGRTSPNPNIKRVKTPKKLLGTREGMLFQIEALLKEKLKEQSWIEGEVAYLRRRKKNLERELLHKKKSRSSDG